MTPSNRPSIRTALVVGATVAFSASLVVSAPELLDQPAAPATTARMEDKRRALNGFVMTGGTITTAMHSPLDAKGLQLLGESVGWGMKENVVDRR